VTDPSVENSTDILGQDYQYPVEDIAEEINVKRETVMWIQFNFYQKYHNRGVCAKMVLENLGAEKNT
jgi:orotate phosphoribosyltransferase-like protein